MWHLLKRHPVPMQAWFRHSLVLTYALPHRVLEPLLPPGLILDTYNDLGFLAIALVQTEDLRPKGWPRVMGQDFFLSGYRIFTRYRNQAGRNLRGLRILRSDTDKNLMAWGGNLLTHYNYRRAAVHFAEENGVLEISIRTPRGEADLEVRAEINDLPGALPQGSPFATLDEARHFAGPLPWTFDYEPQTHSLILIKGVRKQWDPQPVEVDVRKVTFLEQEPFRSANPILANAFHLKDVPYHWLRGQREALPELPPSIDKEEPVS